MGMTAQQTDVTDSQSDLGPAGSAETWRTPVLEQEREFAALYGSNRHLQLQADVIHTAFSEGLSGSTIATASPLMYV
jgi:hypothetical protein|eukprot:CAMPEP_0174302362 /NCGR_PEP_ID=MMETSP0809-20121228/59588_1 /TAXON_ID=73025 ORGANISM="Eutreptiella gymnastica-like, Strain CCMP1594" /NCGR_SAMPLE_ID=MMETSP0809 /ASSEMBLY_ACC=CAM_ASM_000658 /LENGTH=76 /DNA_ID=CAMNT_0015408267 /DNA_START=852 /DNA_END=1082 /DNA_ORIENTATION=-